MEVAEIEEEHLELFINVQSEFSSNLYLNDLNTIMLALYFL